MSKTKRKILIVFIILLIILITSSFCFIFSKKNKTNSTESDSIIAMITSPPITDISWQEAVNMIQNCQIKTVFQKNNLEVTLTNKNQQVFKTIEPKKGDVFIQTNHLRSDCNDIIQTITE
ncbi:MAG: hypothetical protein PHS06_02095 [Candidatus Shapirobacteria bacterium]|nr:hypothetical protein [Candidatus Shapirobacteria bacterium]